MSIHGSKGILHAIDDGNKSLHPAITRGWVGHDEYLLRLGLQGGGVLGAFRETLTWPFRL